MKTSIGQKVKFISGYYNGKEGECIVSNNKHHIFKVEESEVWVSTNELGKYIKVVE